jgi:hypothetical protein
MDLVSAFRNIVTTFNFLLRIYQRGRSREVVRLFRRWKTDAWVIVAYRPIVKRAEFVPIVLLAKSIAPSKHQIPRFRRGDIEKTETTQAYADRSSSSDEEGSFETKNPKPEDFPFEI